MPGNSITSSSLKRLQWPVLLVGLIGLVTSGYGARLHLEQFWQSYLLAYIFWLQLALGCLGMVMLHHLVGGRWSAMILRLMESGAQTLPLLALLFVPIVLALPTLYSWTNPEHVQASALLQRKALYLNVPFFYARAAVYFIVWLTLALLLNRWSRAQDNSGDPRYATRMRLLSGIGVILYVLTATFAAYDWLMALEPEWFSSIYGLVFIAGQVLAALALAIIGLSFLAKDNGMSDEWRGHFNDLGNFLLGFVMLWAYFSFSQFLVIWSADLPEEAIWYLHRSQGGWQTVGTGLIALHFALPFFLLLSRGLKRRAGLLATLAVLILLVRFADLFWLIMPAFYPEGLHWHWLNLTLFSGIGGGWLFVFIRLWMRKSPLPLHDARLADTHAQIVERVVYSLRLE